MHNDPFHALTHSGHDQRWKDEKQQAARRSTWVSVVVNLLLTLGQIITGLISHSSGLVADGIHSLSDLLADCVVLTANRFSHKAADQAHPYGHSRFETAASLMLGLLLLGVGVGMLVSSVHKFQDPAAIPKVHLLALWVALIALLVKEGLFRYMLAVARRVKSSMLEANAWHARSDAASSLVVAVGIVGNLLGIPLFDPLAAAIVGIMVGRMGWKFGYDAFQDLMDRGLVPEQVEAMRQVLTGVEGVINAHDIRTRKMGDAVLIDAHLLVGRYLSVSEGHQIALRAEEALHQAFGLSDITIHIDADSDDPGQDSQLPTREQVLAALRQQLPQGSLESSELLLHYLDGKLEIDLLLPASKQALLPQLQAAKVSAASAMRIFCRQVPPVKEN